MWSIRQNANQEVNNSGLSPSMNQALDNQPDVQGLYPGWMHINVKPLDVSAKIYSRLTD